MRRLLLVLCLCLLTGCYEELDWREYRPADDSFSVLMPDKPEEGGRELSIGAQRLHLNMVAAGVDGLVYGVAYANVPFHEAPTLLSDARDALTKNILGKVVSERPIEIGGAKGIEFVARGEPGGTSMGIVARLVRDEQRFYQVMVVVRQDREDDADTDLFLGSFKPLR